MDNFAMGGNGMSQVLQDANTITLGGMPVNDLVPTQADARPEKNKKTRTVTELLREQNDEVLLKRKQKETRHEETRVAQLNLQQTRAKEDGGESIHKIADITKDLMGLIAGGGLTDIAMDHALSPAEEKSGQKQPEAPQKPVAQPLMTQAEA